MFNLGHLSSGEAHFEYNETEHLCENSQQLLTSVMDK